jgi:hypothetical protein
MRSGMCVVPRWGRRFPRPVSLRYSQGKAQPAAEFGEVSVDDGLVVLAEAAGRLAGGLVIRLVLLEQEAILCSVLAARSVAPRWR